MTKKIVFITGGSKGIGLELVKELLANDFWVINFSRTAPDLIHPKLKHIPIDLADDDHAENKFRTELTQTISTFETQTSQWILINNAAILEPVHLIGQKRNRKALTNHFQINTLIPLHFTSDFLFELRFNKSDKLVINVGSGAANQPIEGWSLYGASKAALHYFTQTVAAEQHRAANPATLVLFDPGRTDTDMQLHIRNSSEADFPLAESFKKAYEEGKLNSPVALAQQLVKRIVDQSLNNGTTVSHKDLLSQ